MDESVNDRVRIAVDYLRQHGLAKNYTTIARRCGLSQSAMTMAVRGERSFPTKFLFDFADAYGIDIWWLWRGTGTMFGTTPSLLERVTYLETKVNEIEHLLARG